MIPYSLTHLDDRALLRDLATLVARDRSTTAELLAHIGEVDARKLYLPAAHPSMYSYCVHELRLSEDSAYKRIQAARTARQFPAIFRLLADGRLHLSAVCLLAPHLTTGNARELLEAATHRTKSEIEQLIAQRFPRTEMFEMVQAVPAPGRAEAQLAPGQVQAVVKARVATAETQLAPGQVGTAAPRARLTPVAARRFALQVTVGQRTHDKLRYAQALLGHQVPSGDLAEVLDHALDALIGKLERRKFAGTDRPRRDRRPPASRGRYIPARVRRAVWERDGGQCTFASAAGDRCPARTLLEFDHIDEVARGGRATEAGIRLRCRAHNQYGAECAFGTGFMSRKREEARRAAAERARELDVVPWLRQLGFRADEARRAAARCEAIPDASLEQRVRLALAVLCRGTASRDLRPAGRSPGTAG